MEYANFYLHMDSSPMQNVFVAFDSRDVSMQPNNFSKYNNMNYQRRT